jgi:hypothetical protein
MIVNVDPLEDDEQVGVSVGRASINSAIACANASGQVRTLSE